MAYKELGYKINTTSSGAPPVQQAQLARVRALVLSPSNRFTATRRLDREWRTAAPR